MQKIVSTDFSIHETRFIFFPRIVTRLTVRRFFKTCTDEIANNDKEQFDKICTLGFSD